MMRRADDGSLPVHATSRKSILMIVVVVYTMAILGEYFLLDTGHVENAARQLRETMLKIKMKSRELSKEIELLKYEDDSRKEKEDKSLQNVFSRAQSIFHDLERYTSGVGRRIVKQGVKDELIRRLSTSLTRLSYEQESNRRRLENLLRELWYFTDAYQFKEMAGREPAAAFENMLQASVDNSTEFQDLRRTRQPVSEIFKDKLRGYKKSISHAIDILRSSDNLDDDRLAMSRELGNLVQKRLKALQNPPSCSSARYLICPKKVCGYACVLHHKIQCLIMAYATGRVMVASDENDFVKDKEKKLAFEPLSETCNLDYASGLERRQDLQNGDSDQVLKYSIIEQVQVDDRKLLPLAVPADLAPKLALFHGNPAAWWVGQVAAYIMRPTPQYQQELNELRERLDLDDSYVAIHVRRTDKIIEAAYHELEEYMRHVHDYYELLETPARNRRVFMASDADLLAEAKRKFPLYRFIINKDIDMDRNSLEGLKGLATDVFFLAHSQYVVCTFSSQVCRLAYELMQTLHGDASSWFRSLDDIYYFGGQAQHLVRAVEPSPESEDSSGVMTMKLEKGDLIQIAGNHWNGYSKGTHTLTRKVALYPSYKTEEVLQYACLPEYPEIYTNSNSLYYI